MYGKKGALILSLMRKKRRHNMAQRVPLMIVPPKITKRVSRLFSWLSGRINKFNAGLKYDLKGTDIGLSDTVYTSYSLVNSSAFFLLFFFLL